MCKILDYSAKSFAVVGETKPIKNELKQLGGKFNMHLNCGAGWIFANAQREAVETFLNSGVITEVEKDEPQEQLIPFCKTEYEALISGNESARMVKYYLQKYDPYMLPSGKILQVEKPSIKTSFCFGENGSEESVDNANRLCGAIRREEDFFIKENLRFAQFPQLTEIDETCRLYKRHTGVYEFTEVGRGLFFTKVADFPNYEEIADEDKGVILKIFEQERALFEKRLHTYLKRYGLSKIHSWTFWTER